MEWEELSKTLLSFLETVFDLEEISPKKLKNVIRRYNLTLISFTFHHIYEPSLTLLVKKNSKKYAIILKCFVASTDYLIHLQYPSFDFCAEIYDLETKQLIYSYSYSVSY